MIKDSGDRTEFGSGAVRDMHEGKGRMDLLPWAAIIEVSKHCEEGAKKYGEHNVDKGIPTHSLCDSAARHLAKYLDGQTDENHLVAAAWNLLWAVQMVVKNPECVDTPWKPEKPEEPEEQGGPDEGEVPESKDIFIIPGSVGYFRLLQEMCDEFSPRNCDGCPIKLVGIEPCTGTNISNNVSLAIKAITCYYRTKRKEEKKRTFTYAEYEKLRHEFCEGRTCNECPLYETEGASCDIQSDSDRELIRKVLEEYANANLRDKTMRMLREGLF